jgi:hypothetical protein
MLGTTRRICSGPPSGPNTFRLHGHDDTEDVELSASETHSVERSGTGLSTTRDTYAGKRLIQEATLFIQEGEALRRQEETDRETTSVEA